METENKTPFIGAYSTHTHTQTLFFLRRLTTSLITLERYTYEENRLCKTIVKENIVKDPMTRKQKLHCRTLHNSQGWTVELPITEHNVQSTAHKKL